MRKLFSILPAIFISFLFFESTVFTGFLQAQWTQTSGPSGGYAYAFLANGSTYFAGTQRGVFRSTDSGLSWYHVQSEMNTQFISSFAMDGTTILAGTEPNGLYYSTDNGITWELSSLSSTNVTALVSTGSSILAGTLGSGIMRSVDHGATWMQTPLANEEITCFVTSGSYIFAGASADTMGIYRSSDDGASWTRCYYADGWPTVALARNSTSIFAATLSTYYMGRVLRSTDNGTTWTITSLSGHKIFSLLTNGTDVYAGLYGEGVYRSTDNGNNWTNTNFGPVTVSAMGLFGTKIFAGTIYYGVYYTANSGSNWYQSVYPNANIVSLGSGNNKIFAGDAESFNPIGMFSSSNTGTNWSTSTLSTHEVDGIAYSGSNLLAATENGIYLSSNDGVNWSLVYGSGIGALTIAASGNYVYAGVGTNGLARSTNSGISWAGTTINAEAVRGIAVSGSTVFVSGDAGLYRSTNNGANWTTTGGPVGSTAITISGTNIYVGFYLGVYMSSDNGNNWVSTTMSTNTTCLASSGSNVFAGTLGNGIYVTKDNGATWILKDEGMGVQYFNTLMVYNNYLYAGTQFSSVWKRSIAEMIGIRQISEEIPQSYSLHQNYPNPFNPLTKIRYEVSKAGIVNIDVFDINGRKTASLLKEYQQPGIYETDFDASKLSSGVYFYRLSAGNYTETKRMILIK